MIDTSTLRQGSFRGVPFFTDGTDHEGGKRGPTHVYPDRDTPNARDLGLDAPGFRIECLVHGEDYLEDARRLREALERPGPGTLVDRYHGTRIVLARNWRVSNRRTAAGVVRFSILFVDAGREVFPSVFVDLASRVRRIVDATLEALRGDFDRLFDVTESAAFVGDAAATLASQAADAVDERVGFLEASGDDCACLRLRIRRFKETARDLVKTPEQLAAELSGIVSDASSAAATPAIGLRTMRELAAFGEELEDPGSATPNREKEGENQRALLSLLRRSALLESARLASRVEFRLASEALALRDEILALLDRELVAAAESMDGAGFNEVQEAFSSIALDLGTRAATLQRLTVLPTPASLPALAVAYRLYDEGAVEEAEPLAARNLAIHPLFLPGGELEVVTAGG